ncbi:ATP-binding protein [Hydrogenibacillus sp. N12]|uniref:HAMP domain-containing sensor histidine kinase n=1 Tax=Hydrogenibacillus sp. N12 TaxID=2866627 RepID=UPI001C7E0D96|nr:ATP-binding protein [Hydrogenibacillus sp. N12]QZA33002.1 cell wall metabolism sensor histidine kinase WalK [Hydrogenibacillus sp. N12]
MRLWTKLAASLGLILVFAFEAAGAFVFRSVEGAHLERFSRALAAQGELLAFHLAPYVARASGEREDFVLADIDNVLKNLSSLAGARVQVLGADGVILAASPPDFGAVGLRNTAPEAKSALAGMPASRRGIQEGLGRAELLAVPIEHDGATVGAVLLVASMEEIYADVGRIMRLYVASAALALGLAIGVAGLITRAIAAPVEALTRQAEAMMGGDFGVRVPVYGEDEIGRLARAFNTLADRLKDALDASDRERRRLASILTHMSEGVLAVDREGRLTAINPKAIRLLGLTGSAERWIGRPAEAAFGLAPEEAEGSLFSRPGTFLFDTPEGRTVRVTTSPVAEAGGTGAIIVLVDVTEDKRLEARQKAFVADVSHELKTPLTTIKSHVEALLDDPPPPAVQAKFLATVARETERMIRLVGDLLFLARLEGEAAPLRRVPLSLERLVRGAAERFRPAFRQAGIALALEAAGADLWADGDWDMLDRVLDNVLSNALKFTPAGGRVTVTLGPADGGAAEIRVEDTGVGIPEEARERVFERFYRVDKARSRAHGGSGLGLSIAREIVERHGGTIRAEGRPGGGTAIVIRLPAVSKAGGAPEAGREASTWPG